MEEEGKKWGNRRGNGVRIGYERSGREMEGREKGGRKSPRSQRSLRRREGGGNGREIKESI